MYEPGHLGSVSLQEAYTLLVTLPLFSCLAIQTVGSRHWLETVGERFSPNM
jgi:hypothetical protein